MQAKPLSLKKWKNPFYTLLIPVGMMFVITVFAYGFMAFMEVNATNLEAREQAGHPLFTWLDMHGTQLVLWELAVLGVLTVGAIATDGWWTSELPQRASLEPSPNRAAEQIPELKNGKKSLLRQCMIVAGLIALLSGLIVNGATNSDSATIGTSTSTWVAIIGAFVAITSLLVRKN
jgi:hypothetical protein